MFTKLPASRSGHAGSSMFGDMWPAAPEIIIRRDMSGFQCAQVKAAARNMMMSRPMVMQRVAVLLIPFSRALE